MNAVTHFVARHRNRLLLATAIWTAWGVLLYVLMPLAAPGLLVLGAVAPVAWYVADRGGAPTLVPAVTTIILLLAGIYLAINASWSLSPADANLTLVAMLVFIVVLHLIHGTLADSDADVLRTLLIALYVGMAIGGAALCFEVLSQQWLYRNLMTIIPQLRPRDRHLVLQGPAVLLQPYLVNRSIAALAFLFWPTMLGVALLWPRAAWRPAWIAGLAPAAAAILTSVHTTSKVAFLGSAAIFGLSTFLPAETRRAIVWGWVAIFILVVPLAMLAYKNQLYLSSWLPRSAQHRIVIWGHTSHLIGNNPILGAGLNTARALNDPHRHDAPVAPGSDFRLTTSLHSHNVYLQTWYETGAVGAALLMALGLAVIGAMARAPQEAQPYLYAAFSACALLGSTSFSLWQPWFMASFGLAAGFAMVGKSLAGRSVSASGAAAPSASAP